MFCFSEKWVNTGFQRDKNGKVVPWPRWACSLCFILHPTVFSWDSRCLMRKVLCYFIFFKYSRLMELHMSLPRYNIFYKALSRHWILTPLAPEFCSGHSPCHTQYRSYLHCSSPAPHPNFYCALWAMLLQHYAQCWLLWVCILKNKDHVICEQGFSVEPYCIHCFLFAQSKPKSTQGR